MRRKLGKQLGQPFVENCRSLARPERLPQPSVALSF
jgi:hypothetical protein